MTYELLYVMAITHLLIRCAVSSTSSTNDLIPRSSPMVGDRAFPVAGANPWNGLPDELTSLQSQLSFRRQLKTFFCFARHILTTAAVIAVSNSNVNINIYLFAVAAFRLILGSDRVEGGDQVRRTVGEI